MVVALAAELDIGARSCTQERAFGVDHHRRPRWQVEDHRDGNAGSDASGVRPKFREQRARRCLMIELRDVNFTHAGGCFSLDVDHLSVNEGQQVCWTGPSGCGKTTLLHLVAGIYATGSGSVKTCDVELSALGDAARRVFRIANVGLVFQDFALLDYLSVLDNILLPYRISRALRLDDDARGRAREVASQVGMGGLLDRRPSELSQGERQRVAVCRAVVTRPQILLADEPTANLDSASAKRVLDALTGYASRHRATLVLVSHDREVISRFDVTTDVARFGKQEPLLQCEGRSHA